MKTILKTLVVLIGLIIGLYVLLVVSLNVYSNFQKRSVQEMTPEKAQKFFERAGGVNEINREASALLNQWGRNNSTFLDESELAKSPAMYSLYTNCETYSGSSYTGTSVAVWSDYPNGDPDNGLVRYIDIKFGNHWSLKHFYIFNPNQTVKFNMPSNWFQVSPNIFAEN